MRLIDANNLDIKLDMLRFYICECGREKQIGTDRNKIVRFKKDDSLLRLSDVKDVISRLTFQEAKTDEIARIQACWSREEIESITPAEKVELMKTFIEGAARMTNYIQDDEEAHKIYMEYIKERLEKHGLSLGGGGSRWMT